jgi:hypothetical protein
MMYPPSGAPLRRRADPSAAGFFFIAQARAVLGAALASWQAVLLQLKTVRDAPVNSCVFRSRVASFDAWNSFLSLQTSTDRYISVTTVTTGPNVGVLNSATT